MVGNSTLLPTSFRIDMIGKNSVLSTLTSAETTEPSLIVNSSVYIQTYINIAKAITFTPVHVRVSERGVVDGWSLYYKSLLDVNHTSW